MKPQTKNITGLLVHIFNWVKYGRQIVIKKTPQKYGNSSVYLLYVNATKNVLSASASLRLSGLELPTVQSVVHQRPSWRAGPSVNSESRSPLSAEYELGLSHLSEPRDNRQTGVLLYISDNSPGSIMVLNW